MKFYSFALANKLLRNRSRREDLAVISVVGEGSEVFMLEISLLATAMTPCHYNFIVIGAPSLSPRTTTVNVSIATRSVIMSGR